MDVQAIIDDIDRQFAQMRRVRELFVSIMQDDAPSPKRHGQSKRSTNKTAEASAPAPKRAARAPKRTMSAEGKARIAAAQKKRWAAQKQAKEPATRKYAAKPKPAKEKAAPATEATTADA